MRRVQRLYRRYKGYLISADLVALLVFLYGEKFLGKELRNALLPAIAVGGLGLLAESVLELNHRLSNDRPEVEFPDDVTGFGNLAKQLLAQPGPHAVHLLVNTGGSSLTAFLREVMKEHRAKLEVTACLFDPDSTTAHLVPDHWPANVRENIKRLIGLKRSNCKLTVRLYSWPPSLNGVMIDGDHLFIGLTSWDKARGRIADGLDHHTYFERSAATEHWFKVFTSWVQCAPLREVAVP